ncbi:MAG: viroplasmin family protein [Bacteroidales bacterium]|nr:viroplasmin family protein [Bacteroidales bacterium]
MAGTKYYVVWRGRQTGVFGSWEACRRQVQEFPGAAYKAFGSREAAHAAYTEGPELHTGNRNGMTKPFPEDIRRLYGEPEWNSLSVDAACSGNPGILEYRGVETASGRELFRKGPFPEGTINIGEFLAIVHGLALLQKQHSHIPVYSDSRTAIKWVKDRKINTKLERSPKNGELFRLVDRAVKWLMEHPYPNRLLKWDTGHWGEIPADFGRK